jgi:hypothetical protein
MTNWNAELRPGALIHGPNQILRTLARNHSVKLCRLEFAARNFDRRPITILPRVARVSSVFAQHRIAVRFVGTPLFRQPAPHWVVLENGETEIRSTGSRGVECAQTTPSERIRDQFRRNERSAATNRLRSSLPHCDVSVRNIRSSQPKWTDRSFDHTPIRPSRLACISHQSFPALCFFKNSAMTSALCGARSRMTCAARFKSASVSILIRVWEFPAGSTFSVTQSTQPSDSGVIETGRGPNVWV